VPVSVRVPLFARQPASHALPSIRSGLGPWIIVGAVAGYLLIVTNTYTMWGARLPLWECLLVIPGLLGLVAGASHRLPSPHRLRQALGGLGLVALLVFSLYAVTRVLHVHIPRRLATGALDGFASLVHLDWSREPIWLLVGIVGVAFAAGWILATRRRTRPAPTEALVLIALVTMVLGDLVILRSMALRDFRLDLGAGSAFLHGEAVYLAGPMLFLPADPSRLPFLYPPLTLPFFGLLASLSYPLVAAAWTIGSVVAAFCALRLFGLSWRWSLLFLLWPGFAEGLYVGNVAVPALLLFAAGARTGGTLVLAGIFKFQNAIPGLWLIRERRWRALLAGIGVLVLLVGASLPLVPLSRWVEWMNGLLYFQQSESQFHGLYGFALPGFLPYPLFLGLVVLAVSVALAARGLPGLRRLGIASVVASPSLYTHGFLVAFPAWLNLSAFWFWAVIALTSSVLGGGWWAAIGVGALAWFVPALARRDVADAALHPLGVRRGSWEPKASPVAPIVAPNGPIASHAPVDSGDPLAPKQQPGNEEGHDTDHQREAEHEASLGHHAGHLSPG
jgi:Glycosyltransferase family 87